MIHTSDGVYECLPCRTRRVYGQYMDSIDPFQAHCGGCHATFHKVRHHCGLCHHTFYTEQELLAHRYMDDGVETCLPADQVQP